VTVEIFGLKLNEYTIQCRQTG